VKLKNRSLRDLQRHFCLGETIYLFRDFIVGEKVVGPWEMVIGSWITS
jgi:hypothetical protein